MSLPKFLTVDEVAAIARAPRSSVFHWVYTGKLKSRRVGKRRLVTEADLARFMDAGRDGDQPERRGRDSEPRTKARGSR
jgi:excisionase family DNA binding protein